MEIDQIVVEIRPRLQVSNFFIQFTQNFASQNDVNLSVRTETLNITLNNDEHYEINLKDFFKLHTRTLSQLLIQKNYISFRINTNEIDFNREILQKNVDQKNANNPSILLQPSFKPQESDIQCSNCCNIFHPKQKFNRILELPSDNLDISDWFCHKPCNFQVLTPKVDEIFYGNFYLFMNPEFFKGLRVKGKLCYCRRCLQFVGELNDMRKRDFVKLWNDTVTFGGEHFFAVDQIGNFIFTLKRLQRDFDDLLGLPQLFKVIFETTLSSGKQNYLLFQVMDHDLDILRMKENSVNLELEKCKVLKVLFKFELDRENALIKYWMSNTNINTVQISPKMFLAVSEYLTKNSKLIAECYRTSQGFGLSYINI